MTSLFKFFGLLVLCASVLGDCTDLEKDVYIRTRKSMFVLDGVWPDGLVLLRVYNPESNDQPWRLQPSNTIGLFNIIAKSTGYALDVSGTYDQENDSYNATVNILNDSLSQQWFVNSDGTIVNAHAIDHVLDVNDDDYVENNYMIVRPATSDSAKFVLELPN